MHVKKCLMLEALRFHRLNLTSRAKDNLRGKKKTNVGRPTAPVRGFRSSKARACLCNKDPKHYRQPRLVPSLLTLRRNVLHFKKVSDILCVIRRQASLVASRSSRSKRKEGKKGGGRHERHKSDPSLEIRSNSRSCITWQKEHPGRPMRTGSLYSERTENLREHV